MISRKNRSLAWLFGGALLLGSYGCSDDDEPEDVVKTRASATADFTQYKTFAFTTREGVEGADQDVEIPDEVEANLKVVNDAVRKELLELGLEEVEGDESPDLYAFNLAATEDVEAIAWTCVPGYWYGWYYWDPCAWLAPIYYEYTVGSVVVGLADAAEEEVVFGGLLAGYLDDGSDVKERIDEGVEEIFDDYPAEQTGSEE